MPDNWIRSSRGETVGADLSRITLAARATTSTADRRQRRRHRLFEPMHVPPESGRRPDNDRGLEGDLDVARRWRNDGRDGALPVRAITISVAMN